MCDEDGKFDPDKHFLKRIADHKPIIHEMCEDCDHFNPKKKICTNKERINDIVDMLPLQDKKINIKIAEEVTYNYVTCAYSTQCKSLTNYILWCLNHPDSELRDVEDPSKKFVDSHREELKQLRSVLDLFGKDYFIKSIKEYELTDVFSMIGTKNKPKNKKNPRRTKLKLDFK